MGYLISGLVLEVKLHLLFVDLNIFFQKKTEDDTIDLKYMKSRNNNAFQTQYYSHEIVALSIELKDWGLGGVSAQRGQKNPTVIETVTS